jgi:hypothetical protein
MVNIVTIETAIKQEKETYAAVALASHSEQSTPTALESIVIDALSGGGTI